MGKKKASIEFQIDLKSLKTVGKINEKTDPKVQEVSIEIAKKLRSLFADGFSSWLSDYDRLVEKGEDVEAYKLVNENKWTFKTSKILLLENLLNLDRSKLDKEQKKDFLLLIIATAAKESNFGRIENEIELFLLEFGDTVDIELKQSIILSKGNGAAQNGKINVANNVYKEVVDNNDTHSVDKAYAYRGLGKIAASVDDMVYYHGLAADKFLECGMKQESITDTVFVAKLYEKDDPETALKLIDKAIQLYDCEKTLDKEFAASLHHTKATYLISVNRLGEALESVEMACELRDNLIGNEYETYSSHSVARVLCERLNKEERALYHFNKTEALAPVISDYEFDLQIRLQDNIDKNEKIDDGLLVEIEKSEFELFKFSAYIFNAVVEKISFEKSLNWLDKAKLLVDKGKFDNKHFAIYYFTAGEVYRNYTKVKDAVKNYELCLEFNPFHYQSIQNCAGIMWKNEMWNESLAFFQKAISNLGESPALCYALGRSYYELGNYQDAFTYFRKISNEIEGVDISNYITECLKRDKDIKLESLDKESIHNQGHISLDSFKKTLEEFSKSISSNSRMYFWKNESGDYKWDTKPEERGKQFLITALEMKYGKDSIEIIQERIAGAGIIDLYLILRGGLKIVVELKVCGGSGYSSTYALSGEDQLIHYLKNTDTNIGFLIVFDGRMRDFEKGFKKVQSIDGVTIFTTAIDMKPTVK